MPRLNKQQSYYANMVIAWESDGKPDSMLGVLDRAWYDMTPLEQAEVDTYLVARDKTPFHRKGG